MVAALPCRVRTFLRQLTYGKKAIPFCAAIRADTSVQASDATLHRETQSAFAAVLAGHQEGSDFLVMST